MRASRIAGWGRRVGAWAGVAGMVTLLSATSAQAQQQAIDPTWLSFDAAARSARFQLIAGLTGQPAGDYLIFCGVAGHGAAGMWIRFQVSASAKTPALLTPAPGKR